MFKAFYQLEKICNHSKKLADWGTREASSIKVVRFLSQHSLSEVEGNT